MPLTIPQIITQYISALIENRYQIFLDSPPIHDINAQSNIFNCINIPQISIFEYLQTLYSNYLFEGTNQSTQDDNHTKTEVACTHLLYFNFFLFQSEYELTHYNVHYLLCASFFHAYTLIVEPSISLKNYQPISGITLPRLVPLHQAFLKIIWAPKSLNFHFILSKQKLTAACLLLKQTFQHQTSLGEIILLHQNLVNLYCKEPIFSPIIIDYQKQIIALFKEISLTIETLKSDRFNQETYEKFNQQCNNLKTWITNNFCPFLKYYTNKLEQINQLIQQHSAPSNTPISPLTSTPSPISSSPPSCAIEHNSP